MAKTATQDAIRADSGVAVVAAEKITKRFPGVVAVDDVRFSIGPGEIVALLGQNGAGKSTLIQILAGLHPHGSYDGKIAMLGRPYRPRSVAEAEAAGVALVPQEVNVAPDLTVAESLFLNAEPTRWGFLDHPLRLARARQALASFGLDIDPAASMKSLDLSTQQLALIARALSKNARLLILDEPTAALTEDEAQRLFERMRSLSARGVAIIFVTHRLAEVFAVSHRIVIMRDGRAASSFETHNVTRDAVVAQMIGGVASHIDRPAVVPGPVALSVANLRVFDPDDPDRVRVRDVSFSLAQGEILGLFGLLGAGCIEAALAIFGAWTGHCEAETGIDDKVVSIDSPAVAVKHGIGFMAQDRRDCLMPEHSAHDNVILASLDKVTRHRVLNMAQAQRNTHDLVRRLDIKLRTIDTLVGTLSGGNQQKVQVARWLGANARILILVDPTRGVDVGARAEIKRVWGELAAAGHAILIASTDAEELVDICDRVLVLRNGRIAGEVARADLTEEKLLRIAANV